MQQLISHSWLRPECILFCCLLDDMALRVLSKADWSQLKALTLSQNMFGPQGIKRLVQADLSCLQKLSIGQPRMSAVALLHLQQSDGP